MDQTNSILLTVDKSHLITIGERLYVESLDLIRELVNNAYDADATVVEVTVKPDEIIVKDDGTGMDFFGLQQYFTIGSQEKIQCQKSKIYNRDQIGQFGIGKFASLSACETFIVNTQKEDFAAEVIFDKKEWKKSRETWELPLTIKAPDPKRGNGTTVILKNLRKQFDLKDVEDKILQSVPLKAPNFLVKLNSHPVFSRSLSGHRIPILDSCHFGMISGEIVIIPQSAASPTQTGIEVKVKQVTIKRELFGMETWGKAMLRVQGEIYAEFLPVTSDRSGFITDSEEYKTFLKVMERVMRDVQTVLGKLSGKMERRKASRALNEALSRIYKALAKNPEFSPFGVFPQAQEEGKGIGGAAAEAAQKPSEEILSENKERKKPKRKKKVKVKRLTPDAIVKKLRIGDMGISFCLDHLGEDGTECFTEGSVIYINYDHPLYQRESKNPRTHTMHVARLLTQEISLMKDLRNPRQAFERQSKLLKDAFLGS